LTSWGADLQILAEKWSASSLRGLPSFPRLILFLLLILFTGCFSKPTPIDKKNHAFSSKEVGLTVSLPPGWNLSEQKNALFVADFQAARTSPVRLIVTDERGVPGMEDYLKIISFQTLAQRMQKVSQGEISHFQIVSSNKMELNGRSWEETVWSGARNDQPKIFHTYAVPVELNVVQFHFEFPVTFYNNPQQFITPVLERVATHPRKRPDEDYVRIYRSAGEFYKNAKLWTDAIGAFEKAATRKPKDAELHALLGESYFQNQEVDRALEAFLQAARLSPQNSRAHQGLADVYLKKGSFDQAISALKRAVNLSPDSAALYIKLGDAYLERARTEEAIQTFQKLIRRNPKAAEAHLGLGKAYLKIDLYEQAGLELERALKLQPELVESHCFLEKVYAQLASAAEAEREKGLCAGGKSNAS
jgi:tetratricopeptide (TPR) repeat protein